MIYRFGIIMLILGVLYIQNIFADYNDLYNPSENISLINEVEIIDITYSLNELNSKNYSNIHTLSFKINNNHPNGFKITIHSDNAGFLKNSENNISNLDADKIAYQITTIHAIEDEDVIGTERTYWGFTTPYNDPQLTLTNVSLENDQEIIFSGSTHGITQATRDFIYRIYFATSKKPELFSGGYNDNITITITNI